MGLQSEPQRTVRVEYDGSTAIIIIDNPPVNAGSFAVRKGLLEAIGGIDSDENVDCAVIIGAGKTFVSGSDIREFGKALVDPQLPAVISAIENCIKPVVAAIHGAALGGGYELALACDARIAAPDAIVGLPEVTLGIIPGAGGTQRLPRLVGVAKAIELITSARRVRAPDALALGMVDAVANESLWTEAVALAKGLGGIKRRVSELPVPSGDQGSIETASEQALVKARGRSTVQFAIDAVRQTQSVSFAEGLANERRVFQKLRVGEEAAALRHLFFAERHAVPEFPDHVESREIKKVGVVGAGTMGTGIAVAFADAGYNTVLIDTDDSALRRGLKRIEDTYKRAASAGRLSPQTAQANRGRILSASDISALVECELVIEAVFEDRIVKQEVLAAVDRILGPPAIIASNTSYLDINDLATATRNPERIVGLHFFSPANVMRLLEIVQCQATSPETLKTCFTVARRLRKIPVLAQVGEGFIGNRIYNAYRTQCEFLLEEGAYPEDIDAALQSFGFAMGPFAVGDLSGLDIAWRTRQRLAASRDPRARYVDILDRLCDAGRFGQKSGAGWYAYSSKFPKGQPDAFTHTLIDEASARKSIQRRAISSDEIIARALGAILNEAALVLSGKIARAASDIDLVMVHGYGFPSHRGGPVFWASRRPRGEINAAIDRVEAASGFGFRRGNTDVLIDGVIGEGSGSIG